MSLAAPFFFSTWRVLVFAHTGAKGREKRMRVIDELLSKSRRAAGVMATMVSAQAYSGVSVDPFEQALLVDLRVPEKSEGLKVRYSSRSTFRGLFGFGWCSSLDGRVVARLSGNREQLFFYGCDQRSGQALDPRLAGKSIRRRGLEYTRVDEQGRVIEFDSAGRVVKVGPHSFEWRDRSLLYRSTTGEESLVLLRDWYGGLRLVVQWGAQRFAYSEQGLLISDSVRVFTYNRFRNIVRSRFMSKDSSIEEYFYDDVGDRLRSVMRQTPQGVERLRLDAGGGDGRTVQETNEIAMELKRGAEMRPVRILYDRLRGALQIEGGDDAAQLILNWLKGGRNE